MLKKKVSVQTTSVPIPSSMNRNAICNYKNLAHCPRFKCTWKGCGVTEFTSEKIEAHVRNAHLGPKRPRHSFEDDGTFSDSDHEEEFYYTEIEDDADEGKAPSPPSPPTLSHRDMARPPHEDPEYQRQIVGNFRLLAQSQSANLKSPNHNLNHANSISNIPTSPLAHHNYPWSASVSAGSTSANPAVVTSSTSAQHSPVSPMKHARWSPRPSTSSAPYPSPTYVHHHHHNYSSSVNIHNTQLTITPNPSHHHQLAHSAPNSTSTLTISPNINSHHQHHMHHQQSPTTAHHLQSPGVAAANRSPQSPNRRTRGENKKCRKVYGMDRKDQWCTQCKWKKACSRFGD